MNDLSSGGINLDAALDILRRRLWIAITLFSVVLTITLSLVAFLPNIYKSSAFILVEGQQIPREYVRSTVTTGVETRLHKISQEILSRSRLQQLMKELNLYTDLRGGKPLEEVILAMRRDIGLKIKNVRGQGRQSTVGFEVSYTGTDPRKVMLVANRLSSYYIEENLKFRQRQALGTENFLKTQLQGVKERLEEQEQRIAQYKQRFLGELPGQLEANLRTLELLQAQIQLLSDNRARALERRDVLVGYINQINGYTPSLLEGDPTPDSLVTRIDDLNDELAMLKSRFSDKHPDVIRLEHVITSLEVPLENRNEEAEPQPDSSSPTARPNPLKTRLQVSMIELDTEIKLRKAELEKTRHTIALYQKRIENTPKREVELISLTRDYDTSRELYTTLLKRREEAELATSMEQRQKAERFRILDPAIYPRKPVGPNRLRLILLGLFLGLGMAGAGVFLKEMQDTSFHRLEDLQTFTKVPILVAIPHILLEGDRWRNRLRHCLGGAVLALLLLVLVGATYYITVENGAFVMRIVGTL